MVVIADGQCNNRCFPVPDVWVVSCEDNWGDKASEHVSIEVANKGSFVFVQVT